MVHVEVMNLTTRLSLLEEVQQQSELAWDEFSAIYSQLLQRWLAGEGLQSTDADDIRQDVMLVVMNEIVHFQHSGRVGAFRCWLRRILANRLMRFFRAKGRSGYTNDLSIVADELFSDDSEVSRNWDLEHDRFIMMRLVESLESRFSHQSILIFKRVVLAGEDASLVANEVGVTLGALRVAQHRVLQALKTLADGLVAT